MTRPAATGLLSPHTALFLDFDGTLAALQDNPDAVCLPPGGAELLRSLSARLGGALALVSGRDGRDLAKRVPDELWRAGNHGDMVLEPGEAGPTETPAPPTDLLAQAKEVIGGFDGARLEQKARVLAFHTRACPHHADALAAALAALVDSRTDYILERGKDIAELKPTGVDKGEAVKLLMQKITFEGRVPLFIGDDTTDEDGFAASLALNGSAIKIGQGATCAPFRLEGPSDVWRFLRDGYNDLA
ncbi:MAG: trehalose-phosphatase [Pseudomonadota bacterium]